MIMYTVILEIGFSFIRVGFAGDAKPRFVDELNVDIQSRAALMSYLSFIFIERLQIKTKECRLLFIENIVSSKNFREIIFDICMSYFQFQAVTLQPDILLPFLTTKLSNGVLVDIGTNECRVICVAEDRPILQSLKCKAHFLLLLVIMTVAVCSVGVLTCIEEFKVHIHECLSEVTDDFATRLFSRKAGLSPDYNLYPVS